MLPRRNIDRFLELYLRDSDLGPADPAVSPLLADLEDVAPALVITADNDPLEDDGERYAGALRSAGSPPGTPGTRASRTGSCRSPVSRRAPARRWRRSSRSWGRRSA